MARRTVDGAATALHHEDMLVGIAEHPFAAKRTMSDFGMCLLSSAVAARSQEPLEL
jgi:hypothetical protein